MFIIWRFSKIFIWRGKMLFISGLMVLMSAMQDIPAPLVANGAWSNTLIDHPRLFGSKSHLQMLAKAKPEAYKEIRTEKSLIFSGITHTVEGISSDRIQNFINLAMKNVDRGITNLHQDTWIWLTDAVITYDFFFNEMKQEDKDRMIEWFNAHLDKFTTDENAFHNSTLSKILCYLRIAYGTWGENPKAKDFRDYAIKKLYEGKIVPVLLEFGEGGGYTECGWYTRGSLWHLVQALELARRIEGYDGFQKAPQFFYQRLAYEMLQPYPGLWTYSAEHYAEEGDGASTYGGHTEYPRHLRTMLAQYFRGSELSRYIANKRRKGSNPDSRLVDFLYEEEPDQALDIKNFPLAHYASGIGKVYARSDWTDEATWFRFECGDMWNHHQHFEVGNFEIFRYESLATESGEYHDYSSNHSVNWLLRTIAHNCILVYKPDEKWGMLRDGGKQQYANDGGQTKKWEWVVDNLDVWKSKKDQFERGNIVAYENHPEFMFVAGDCTKAYVSSKLESWIRQIIFIRPHTFVILDWVISTKPEYEKTWLLHCKNEPQIDGNKIAITNGKGKLFVETLLPENPTVRKVYGYQYQGQAFDPPQTAHTPLANKWRIEVLPSGMRKEDVFLHVLSTERQLHVQLISDQGKIGVDIDGIKIIFADDVGGELNISGKVYHF
jgi:hypothetical protein